MWAIAEGRSAAAAVDAYLSGATMLPAPLREGVGVGRRGRFGPAGSVLAGGPGVGRGRAADHGAGAVCRLRALAGNLILVSKTAISCKRYQNQSRGPVGPAGLAAGFEAGRDGVGRYRGDVTNDGGERDPESEPFGRLPAEDDEDVPTPGDLARDDDSDPARRRRGRGRAEQGDDANHTALPPKVEAWRRRSATGAVLTGFALGLQQALGKEQEQPAIVMQTSGDPPRDLPVEAEVEQGRPRQSVVNIRPWLLRRAPQPGRHRGRRPGRGHPGRGHLR